VTKQNQENRNIPQDSNFSFFPLHFLSNQTKGSLKSQTKTKKPNITKIINRDSSITEPPSWAVGVKVSTIRKVVGACHRGEEVVGATIDGGVANDE
jgi:hypothetical protein